jgi:hypothetical protein
MGKRLTKLQQRFLFTHLHGIVEVLSRRAAIRWVGTRSSLIRRGLVVWSAETGRPELTPAGRAEAARLAAKGGA